MTRKDTRYLQASRRLRHATWAKEPALPAWSLWIVGMFLAAFVTPLILGAA